MRMATSRFPGSADCISPDRLDYPFARIHSALAILERAVGKFCACALGDTPFLRSEGHFDDRVRYRRLFKNSLTGVSQTLGIPELAHTAMKPRKAAQAEIMPPDGTVSSQV